MSAIYYKRPFPKRPSKTIKLVCLGPCRRPFMSSGPTHNRLCKDCLRLSDGIMSGAGSIGSPNLKARRYG